MPLVVSLPHGTAVILTQPHPFRSKPNQDSVAVLPVTQDDALLVVADGMGGASAGELASNLTLKTLADTYFNSEGDDIPKVVERSIEQANQHEFAIPLLADIVAEYAGLQIGNHFGYAHFLTISSSLPQHKLSPGVDNGLLRLAPGLTTRPPCQDIIRRARM